MSTLEQLAGRWKSGNGIEVERIHITRSEFDAMKAEDGELRAESGELRAEVDSQRDLGQMIKDRIAQMPDDEDCSGLIDGAAAINEITRVCNSRGHKCDDDSLWFQGSEWNAIIQEREDLREERDQLRAENLALIEQCAQACEAESVDADETGSAEDRAYNMAITHAAAAIRALNVKGPF